MKPASLVSGMCGGACARRHPRAAGEVAAWGAIAWPSSLSIICRLGMAMTDISVLGYLSTGSLAGASLSLVVQTLTSACVWGAFGSALNTLASQAYGARQYARVGLYLQTVAACASAACVPVACAWWYTEAIVTAAGFGGEQARLAGEFSRLSILGLVPNVLYQLFATFWQVQQIVRPALVVSIIFLLANAGLNVVLVFGVGSFGGWGFAGSPIATSLTRTGMLLALWAYAVPYRRLHEKCWAGFTARAFDRDIVRAVIVRQALPSLLAGALESWQLQVRASRYAFPHARRMRLTHFRIRAARGQCCAFFAARLGPIPLAAHMAMLNFYYFTTSIQFGFSGATAVRVGYHLGGGRVREAKLAGGVGLVFCASAGAAVAVSMHASRASLGRLFSADPAVWAEISTLAPLVGGGYAAMSIFYAAVGVLSGQASAGTFDLI